MTTPNKNNVLDAAANQAANLTAFHLRFGWWSLLVFLTLGVVLELLHGFKIDWYLSVSNETRRFMWTLAHAHGTLLSMVHIAFAGTIWLTSIGSRTTLASRALCSAGILMPAGFFFGGIQIYSGDPGIGILLLPAGPFLLFVAVLFTALHVKKIRQQPAE